MLELGRTRHLAQRALHDNVAWKALHQLGVQVGKGLKRVVPRLRS